MKDTRIIGRARLRGFFASSLLVAAGTHAQITPERTYYGIDRPLPVSVSVPEGAEEARIVLYHAEDFGTEVASADVAPGRADLAALFPLLWSDEHRDLHYAQLIADGRKIGPALVLQPMLTPAYAYPIDPRTGQPQIPPRRAEPMFEHEIVEAMARQQGVEPPPRQVVFSGIRAWPEQFVVISTTKGDITFRLRPDQAPNTCWNFQSLVEGGFYTDIIFHRVVAQAGNGHPFVIQVGDPTGTGAGGPGYFIDLEDTGLPHDFGVLSMARSGEPNSNGSQVFVCLSREGTAFLDGRYTAFAEAIDGADVIRAIAAVPVGPGDRPVDPPKIIEARLVAASPAGEAPLALSKREAEAEEAENTEESGTGEG